MTENQTPNFHAHGTILNKHGSATRLVAAVRYGPKGHVFQHFLLDTAFPAWDAARAEAAERFPGVTFHVPRLGEMPPSVA